MKEEMKLGEGEEISVDDLPVVMEELNDARAKWYDINWFAATHECWYTGCH